LEGAGGFLGADVGLRRAVGQYGGAHKVGTCRVGEYSSILWENIRWKPHDSKRENHPKKIKPKKQKQNKQKKEEITEM
jgi:hypothetical protein